jgi:hypothetical protein
MAAARQAQPTPPNDDAGAIRRRALATWPRLDPAALRRCGDDIERVATLIERRSTLPRTSILGILAVPAVSEDERSTWFG